MKWTEERQGCLITWTGGILVWLYAWGLGAFERTRALLYQWSGRPPWGPAFSAGGQGGRAIEPGDISDNSQRLAASRLRAKWV